VLIRDILTRNSRLFPNRTAIAAENEVVTYMELSARVVRRAADLSAHGVGKGDRVAVLMRNSPLYAELLYAVTGIGGVLLPLNELLIGREIKEILAGAEAKVLVFGEEFRETAEKIRTSLPGIAFFAGSEGRERGGAAPAAESPGSSVRTPLSETDIAVQIPVPDATGSPRGAMLSHRNLVASAAMAALELGLSRNDVAVFDSPLSFMAGTGRLLRFQYMGGAVVFPAGPDPEETLRAVESRRATRLVLSPAAMARIVDHPSAGKHDISSLRTVLYGGSSIPPGLRRRAASFFRCGMVQSYGHVESSGILTFLHAEDHAHREDAPPAGRLHSIGKEAIGVQVRIVDGNGNELPADQVGEIVARGPNVFEGYFRNAPATEEALRNGWLHTGDIGAADAEGYVFIVDRMREDLSVGGLAVSPREVETVLAAHPAVREAAVIGHPDYAEGEVPSAVVELKEGESASANVLIAYCRENLAPFKVPRSIVFLPRLPRNSQGKVLKVKLREKLASGAPPRTPGR
jgi:acyl-CoA synthetase (AMP-forming)/AMP-acid ligase II